MTIGNSVTSIASSAFSGCSGLTEVHISDLSAWCKINFYNNKANPLYYAGLLFLEGKEIKDLVIPEGVTRIGSSAFYNCSGLTSVTIGNNITSIGYDAFYNCSGLTSVTIGNNITSIGDDAFYNCSGLTEVHISDLTAWCKINFSDNQANPLYYARDLFLEGKEIKDLVIPEGVTSIGSSAFYNCSGLTSVTIPNSVTSIGDYAFYNCYGLTDVYCYALSMPETYSMYFTFHNSNIDNQTLHVPAESIEDYKTTAPWSRFGKIVALTEEETGIENIEAENANSNDAPVYNINGMKMQDVDNLPKGIYIKGGKMYLVK